MKHIVLICIFATTLAFGQAAPAAPHAPSAQPAPAAAKAAPAEPHGPDYTAAIANLQRQVDDVTKDLRLDYAALQNLTEFQSYLAHSAQAGRLEQQLNNLKAQQAAAASKRGAAAPK